MTKTFRNCNVTACCKYAVVTTVLVEKDNRPRDYPRAGEGMTGAVRKITDLLSIGATDVSATTHREKTASILSSMK
jgi:hypothetical protein